jgi:short-subunit dehydrogenase
MDSVSRPTALITGASSGIGAVYARRLAARGFDLILVARRIERLKTLANELSASSGIQATSVEADLASESGLRKVEDILSSDASISMLVNNAGISGLGGTESLTAETVKTLLNLNTVAVTCLSRAALSEFLARDKGTIVNISSVMSLEAMPITSIYSGTKAYVTLFSRGLQQETENTNVRVQVVLPAAVATEIYDGSIMPLNTLPEEIVMSAENMVDAALAGLDAGELVTLPSVDDLSLWENYEVARKALFGSSQTRNCAQRYGLSKR